MAPIKVIIHVPAGWALPVGWLFLSPAICLAFIFSASYMYVRSSVCPSCFYGRYELVLVVPESKILHDCREQTLHSAMDETMRPCSQRPEPQCQNEFPLISSVALLYDKGPRLCSYPLLGRTIPPKWRRMPRLSSWRWAPSRPHHQHQRQHHHPQTKAVCPTSLQRLHATGWVRPTLNPSFRPSYL